MKMRIVVGSLVSAVVLFFWGFAYWGVLAMTVSPWNAIAADSDPDVIATLKAGVSRKRCVHVSVGRFFDRR